MPDLTAGDRRRAAEMLACGVMGDQLGVSAAMIGAVRAGRLDDTLQAVAVVAVEVLPELRETDLVDRLRAIAATTVVPVKPTPPPVPPQASPASKPWQTAATLVAEIRANHGLPPVQKVDT